MNAIVHPKKCIHCLMISKLEIKYKTFPTLREKKPGKFETANEKN